MKGQPLTPEQKEKMAAGRKAAAEKRQREAIEKAAAPVPEPVEEFPAPRPAVPVDPPPEELVKVSGPPAVAGFQRFVDSLDDETRQLLTIDQLAEIWGAQCAKAEAEKVAAKKKAAADKALTFARIEAGIIPAASAEEIRINQRNAEMVTWRCDLPESGGDGHRVDQTVYLNGLYYTTTRAVYDSVRDTAFKAYKAEQLFKGEKSTYYDQQRQRFIDPWSGGVMPGPPMGVVRGR